jgi:retinol-binding protein 3
VKTIVLIARLIVILLVALFIFRFMAAGQTPAGPPPDLPIDGPTKAVIVKNLVQELNDGYVFVETAAKMSADIQSRLASKEYDDITSSRAFADKLTSDLQAISHDKHLRVRFSFEELPVRKQKREPTSEEIARNNQFMKRVNYGFDRAERLDGNIGYIELRGFFDPEDGAQTVQAAMTLVANTDALIFDLRQNGGGDPRMVALVCSYLFGDKKVHLNDLYFRPADRTEEFWTNPSVPGKKFVDKDVYVLTSQRTFSGAEEFSNNLKELKRATIVGETTGGGANPGSVVRLNEHFGVFVPTGRAINPISKKNWEGTGVEPDIKVPKEQALKVAYLMALRKSFEKESNPNFKSQLQEVMDITQKQLDAIKGGK